MVRRPGRNLSPPAVPTPSPRDTPFFHEFRARFIFPVGNNFFRWGSLEEGNHFPSARCDFFSSGPPLLKGDLSPRIMFLPDPFVSPFHGRESCILVLWQAVVVELLRLFFFGQPFPSLFFRPALSKHGAFFDRSALFPLGGVGRLLFDFGLPHGGLLSPF